ncbi:MAG: fumarylacetoacetate hydrolase family protein [Paracoccaceae bacterium]
MKLCSFIADGRASFGLVTESGIVDLGRRLGFASLRDLLAADALDSARACAGFPVDYAFDAVDHAPVIPNPEKIYCVGLNYRDHVEETGNVETPHPTLFARYPASQVGHNQPMIKPRESDMFDYEGELALIIGKGGRRISVDNALSHVAGYACYNEGSVRDYQRHTAQYLPGKTFMGTGGFGPWMVTADEIPDPSTLHLQTRVNGQVLQDSSLKLLITPIPQIIAYASTMIPLVPGDVIVTGTPGGVGSRRTPPIWLRDGDLCEVEISGIGVLRNRVVAEA